MDFHLDENLEAVRDLSREILGDRATPERLREIESGETRVDAGLWDDLAKAGLLGIAVPEEDGGAGLGVSGLVVVLEEQGRTLAPVPLWSAGVAGLLLATHGSAEQRQALLPAVAEGTLRCTVALEEYDGVEPAAPRCQARPAGDSWTLTGRKAVVPSPVGADRVLVSATAPDGPGVFLVDGAGPGVSWELSGVTSHDLAGELTLQDAPAERVGAGQAHPDLLRLAGVAVAAIQVGVAEGALAIAADYTRNREQFGRPLGSFQALQHQLADCWIDIDAMRVTLWQAVTDLEHQGESVDRSVLVAKWWCGQAGLDVVHRVQHVHGGIGVDVDYPVHRYFLWGKQLSNTLGGPAATLEQLGEIIAVTEVRS